MTKLEVACICILPSKYYEVVLRINCEPKAEMPRRIQSYYYKDKWYKFCNIDEWYDVSVLNFKVIAINEKNVNWQTFWWEKKRFR